MQEERKTETQLLKVPDTFRSHVILPEEALQNSKEKWCFFLKNIPDVILNLVRNGTILFINHTISGYTVKGIVGKTIYDLIPQEQHEKTRKAIEEVFKTSKIVSFDTNVSKPDGNLLWYSNRLGPVKNRNKIVSVAQISTNTTKHESRFQKLQESEQRNRLLTDDVLNSSKVGIFILDSTFKVVWMNQAMECYFGLRKEDIIGKDKRQLIREQIKDIFEEPETFVENTLASYNSNTYLEKFECHVLADKQREDRWLEYWSKPIHSGLFTGGRIEHYNDITERKKAEETLNTCRERMIQAERLASLGTLSATVAHELTQPLTAIRLSIQNSLAELMTMSCPSVVMDDLEYCLAEVSRVASIADRFRNFARESFERIITKIDLKAVAHKIVDMLNENAWRAKVTLKIEGFDRLPPIYSNEQDLEQLFFALANNAIQAADGKKNRQLIISGAARDEHVELRFSDNCGGIESENLDKIFEPFFTTKPMGKGTGLGLYIVQRIVSRANGKIWVESKAGEGSSFFIIMPVDRGKRL